MRTAYTSNGKTIVPAGDYSIKNVVIERNRVSGKAAGIILNDVKNATLRNNIIYECDKHGLQIHGKFNGNSQRESIKYTVMKRMGFPVVLRN